MSLLGIDVGTSGCKVVLTDDKGSVLSKAYYEYPLSTPRAGWSEQNPEDWYEAACAGIKKVTQEVSPEDIKGVSVSGMMSTLVVLDDSGRVIRPAILWNDQRSVEEADEVTAHLGMAAVLENTANIIFPSFFAPKVLWLKKHEPKSYEKIRWVLFPKDYIVYRLTGNISSDVTDMSASCVYNVKDRCYADVMCEAFGIDKSWLPPCVDSATIVGHISARAMGETGLTNKTAVAAGGGDQACQALGMGIIQPGMCSVTVGTSGVVFVNTSNFCMEKEGRLHAFCHGVKDQWYMMGVMLSAGGSYQWFRNILREANADMDYDVLDQMAEKSPVGSRGITFLPYLCGERCPHNDVAARGVFFGLNQSHTLGDMARSVMEGITYGLLDCFKAMKASGCDIDRIYVSGGASKSDLWMHIIADMFGVPAVQSATAEAGALGAVMLAGVGCGVYADMQSAASGTARTGKEYLPDEKKHLAYEEKYMLYTSLYDHLKEVYTSAWQLEERNN